MNKTCDCKDWGHNFLYIINALTFIAMHGDMEIRGKPFEYCPWCGNKLLDSNVER